MEMNHKEMQLMENSRAMEPKQRAWAGWRTFYSKGDRINITQKMRKAPRTVSVEGVSSPGI